MQARRRILQVTGKFYRSGAAFYRPGDNCGNNRSTQKKGSITIICGLRASGSWRDQAHVVGHTRIRMHKHLPGNGLFTLSSPPVAFRSFPFSKFMLIFVWARCWPHFLIEFSPIQLVGNVQPRQTWMASQLHSLQTVFLRFSCGCMRATRPWDRQNMDGTNAARCSGPLSK